MSPRDFLKTETLRLAALRTGDLLNTPLESRFNRLTRLARRALGVQAATISLFDGEREWIKAADGWDLRQLPPEHSLVGTLARDGIPRIVDDTLLDVACRDHHFVTHAPKVRFCAVYPLRDDTDNVIGALAVYDSAPRRSTEQMVELLRDVGQLAQRELFLVEAGGAQEQLLMKLSAARRQALLDELTRLWNRRGGLQLLERAIADGARLNKGLGVCIADVDRFKDVNDRHGHLVGDILLKRVAAAMVDCVRAADAVCRLGGEEFLLIVPEITVDDLTDLLERIRERVAAQAARVDAATVSVTVSLGGYLHAPGQPATADDLLRRADGALYRAKAAGRNVVVLS